MRWPSCEAGTQSHHVPGRTDGRAALVTSRPFRAPHQTIAAVGRIDGGQIPLPGEVSRAPDGARCLDELPPFPWHVLEVLRRPLENDILQKQCPVLA